MTSELSTCEPSLHIESLLQRHFVSTTRPAKTRFPAFRYGAISYALADRRFEQAALQPVLRGMKPSR